VVLLFPETKGNTVHTLPLPFPVYHNSKINGRWNGYKASIPNIRMHLQNGKERNDSTPSQKSESISASGRVSARRIRFLRHERFDWCGCTRDQSNNLLRPPSTVDCERSSAWLARIERGRAVARAAERGRAARFDGASRALPGGRAAARVLSENTSSPRRREVCCLLLLVGAAHRARPIVPEVRSSRARLLTSSRAFNSAVTHDERERTSSAALERDCARAFARAHIPRLPRARCLKGIPRACIDRSIAAARRALFDFSALASALAYVSRDQSPASEEVHPFAINVRVPSIRSKCHVCRVSSSVDGFNTNTPERTGFVRGKRALFERGSSAIADDASRVPQNSAKDIAVVVVLDFLRSCAEMRG